MTYPTITNLPDAPSRQDPANFATEADAFLGALPTFQTEVNAAGDYIEGKAAEVEADANAAASSASDASTSADNAAAAQAAAESAADASLWVSGTTYVVGDVVYSPITYFTYRSKTNHSGATDPSSDSTNWVLIGVGGTSLLSVTNITATQDQTAFTGSYTAGAVVVTLNGVILTDTTDYTATDGTNVTLAAGADAGDEVGIIGFPTFVVANTLPLSGGTLTGALAGTTATFSGEFIAESYNETFDTVTSTSNATTIDCETGNVFFHDLTENTTFTFSNPPSSGTAYGFTLKLAQDATARTVTWPASVDWPGGEAPTISEGSGEVDVFVFFTHDGGTNWYGFTAGQVMS